MNSFLFYLNELDPSLPIDLAALRWRNSPWPRWSSDGGLQTMVSCLLCRWESRWCAECFGLIGLLRISHCAPTRRWTTNATSWNSIVCAQKDIVHKIRSAGFMHETILLAPHGFEGFMYCCFRTILGMIVIIPVMGLSWSNAAQAKLFRTMWLCLTFFCCSCHHEWQPWIRCSFPFLSSQF